MKRRAVKNSADSVRANRKGQSTPTSLNAANRRKAKGRRTKAIPRTAEQYRELRDSEQERWNRALHVVAKMRSEGTSLTKAAREFGLAPRIVKARAGSALRKTKSGRYVPRPSDKLLRVLVIPGPHGQREVVVKDSTVASKIAEYSDAVQKYLRTGDASGLKKFRRMKLLDEKGTRIKLLTDLAELQKLGSAGVLSFESLYARTS